MIVFEIAYIAECFFLSGSGGGMPPLSPPWRPFSCEEVPAQVDIVYMGNVKNILT